MAIQLKRKTPLLKTIQDLKAGDNTRQILVEHPDLLYNIKDQDASNTAQVKCSSQNLTTLRKHSKVAKTPPERADREREIALNNAFNPSFSQQSERKKNQRSLLLKHQLIPNQNEKARTEKALDNTSNTQFVIDKIYPHDKETVLLKEEPREASNVGTLAGFSQHSKHENDHSRFLLKQHSFSGPNITKLKKHSKIAKTPRELSRGHRKRKRDLSNTSNTQTVINTGHSYVKDKVLIKEAPKELIDIKPFTAITEHLKYENDHSTILLKQYSSSKLKGHPNAVKTSVKRDHAYKDRKKTLKLAFNTQSVIDSSLPFVKETVFLKEEPREEIQVGTLRGPSHQSEPENSQRSLLLKDNPFLHENVTKLRRPLKSAHKSAERVRAYRERKNAIKNASNPQLVTDTNQSHLEDPILLNEEPREATLTNFSGHLERGNNHRNLLSKHHPFRDQNVTKLGRHLKIAKTPVERNRAYRERKKALKNAANAQLAIEKKHSLFKEIISLKEEPHERTKVEISMGCRRHSERENNQISSLLKRNPSRDQCVTKLREQSNIAKTSTERVRCYRERKKVIKNAFNLQLVTDTNHSHVEDPILIKEKPQEVINEGISNSFSQHSDSGNNQRSSLKHHAFRDQTLTKCRKHSKTAKTSGERNRAYRERKKALKNASKTQLVLDTNNSHDKETVLPKEELRETIKVGISTEYRQDSERESNDHQFVMDTSLSHFKEIVLLKEKLLEAINVGILTDSHSHVEDSVLVKEEPRSHVEDSILVKEEEINVETFSACSQNCGVQNRPNEPFVEPTSTSGSLITVVPKIQMNLMEIKEEKIEFNNSSPTVECIASQPANVSAPATVVPCLDVPTPIKIERIHDSESKSEYECISSNEGVLQDACTSRPNICFEPNNYTDSGRMNMDGYERWGLNIAHQIKGIINVDEKIEVMNAVQNLLMTFVNKDLQTKQYLSLIGFIKKYLEPCNMDQHNPSTASKPVTLPKVNEVLAAQKVKSLRKL